MIELSVMFDKFQFYQENAQSFSVTRGESVLSNSTLDESTIINTAEEADQKLGCHMFYCVRSGVKQCIVRTVDTGVIMSLISYRQLAENFGRAVFACLSSAVSNRFYNINKFAAARGERCRALPFMR